MGEKWVVWRRKRVSGSRGDCDGGVVKYVANFRYCKDKD